MPPKVQGLIVVLGNLLAIGIDISSLVSLALLLILMAAAGSLLLRGKGIAQWGASFIGLLLGPCLVAAVLRFLFTQLRFPSFTHFTFGWMGIALLAVGFCLVSFISYAIVKNACVFFNPICRPRRMSGNPSMRHVGKNLRRSKC